MFPVVIHANLSEKVKLPLIKMQRSVVKFKNHFLLSTKKACKSSLYHASQ